MTHWVKRLKRPTHCLTCGWKLGRDMRRRYCTDECFLVANRKYHRYRKRIARLIAPELHREAVRKYRETAADFYPRQRILNKAKRESQKTGLSKRLILMRWGEPVGRVKESRAWQQ